MRAADICNIRVVRGCQVVSRCCPVLDSSFHTPWRLRKPGGCHHSWGQVLKFVKEVVQQRGAYHWWGRFISLSGVDLKFLSIGSSHSVHW
jgi:hypothetical protein